MPTLLIALALCLCSSITWARESAPFRDPTLPIETRIDDLLSRMTLAEKLEMTGGAGDGFSSPGVARLGVPPLLMADGPQGVRGPMATAFPTQIAMVATWNPELVRKIGSGIGRELRASGRNVILGPYPNIYRVPQAGRTFECMGEDPLLNARITEGYVKGTNDARVITSTKVFLLNNQELNRTTIDMRIDERSLRELELPAFEAAIEAGTQSIMASYNKVDGLYMSENANYLTRILKGDLGFKGFVVSDWGATMSRKAANAGLDLEMPFATHFGPHLASAVSDGSVTTAMIDDKVRRILRSLVSVGDLDEPRPPRPGDLNSRENQKIALAAAEESIVLLKNLDSTLPLDPRKVRTVAVLGPGASNFRHHGFGSGEVRPPHVVTTLHGLRKHFGENVVRHSPAITIPGQSEPITLDDTRDGFKAEYFDSVDLSGHAALTRVEPYVMVWGGLRNYPSMRWTGTLNVPRSGDIRFHLWETGRGYRLYLDGKLIKDRFNETSGWDADIVATNVSAGPHDFRLEYKHDPGTWGIRFMWELPAPDFDESIRMASEADAAIVVVGTAGLSEMESRDRADIRMPGDQEKLVKAVARVNPRTIVVINSGGPVLMRDWVDHVPAVLQAWFPGQEGGNAIAKVIAGISNPSGKLPYTMPRSLADSPSTAYYPGDGVVMDYGAVGVLEGYRGYEARGTQPEFPFGHGLSYTKFAFEQLRARVVNPSARNPKVRVTLKLANTGRRIGAEVVQLYVTENDPVVVRPPKELKEFAKIRLAPGERRKIAFELDAKAFRHWSPTQRDWQITPGKYTIHLGSSSADIRASQEVELR